MHCARLRLHLSSLCLKITVTKMRKAALSCSCPCPVHFGQRVSAVTRRRCAKAHPASFPNAWQTPAEVEVAAAAASSIPAPAPSRLFDSIDEFDFDGGGNNEEEEEKYGAVGQFAMVIQERNDAIVNGTTVTRKLTPLYFCLTFVCG